MTKPETPEAKAKRQVSELLKIREEQGVEAAREATAKLFLDILKGRAR